MEGSASGTRGVVGIGVVFDSSTRWRVRDDSNQKRHVIWPSQLELETLTRGALLSIRLT